MLAVLSGGRAEADHVESRLGALPSEHRRHICGETESHRLRKWDISVTPNLSTLISYTEPASSGPLSLRVHDNTQCVSGHPGTEARFVFSLSQHVQRQEQKLIFTSLTWHVELVGPLASPTSPAGGCLEECCFSPWRAGFFRDSYACVSRHFHGFSGHRREASVLRTSALSSRTCTYMQGRWFQLNVGSATTDREMWSATSCII